MKLRYDNSCVDVENKNRDKIWDPNLKTLSNKRISLYSCFLNDEIWYSILKVC